MDSNLDDEEAQLLARLAAIKQEKEKLRLEMEARKAVVIQVKNFDSGKVIARFEPYREDIVTLARSIPGRLYNGVLNSIPANEWEKFVTAVEALPNVKMEVDLAIITAINKYLYAPHFDISKTDRIFKVVVNHNANTHNLRLIPGIDYKLDHYAIPLSEGWRLWDFCSQLPEGQTVVWSPEASVFVAEQVEGRMKLDKIALAKDWPISISGLNATPKPFQNVGCAFFEANGGSGILADEMGLGKSLQFIMRALQVTGKVVIVPPAALKINWIREIQKFTSEKSYTLSGTTPTHYDIAVLLSRDCPKFVIINYDILSTSVEIDESYWTIRINGQDAVVSEAAAKLDQEANGRWTSAAHHKKFTTRYPWIEILNMMNIDLLGYDEAHYIKNVGSNRSQASRLLQAKRIMCLTGTPVLNRPGELWPMLHIVDPITFPIYERFLNQYSYDGKQTKNVEELREMLKPLMIRRLKKDVYDELPPLNRIDEFYELSPRAKKLYNRALQGVYEVVATWNPSEAGAEKSIQNILVRIMRLKQICAIDKVPATADLATRIFDSSDPSERPKKVLVFSQFRPTAYAITVRLGSEAIGFVSRNASGEFVTANPTEQDKLVQEFQNNPEVHYLVVTEKTAKEGHNITEAMAVVFNDFFWTPAGHQQAEGRAYMRNNDPHGIDSYWHIATETIDEWVLELLMAKLAIIESTVDGVNTSRVVADESIVKELIQKIKDGLWKK